MLQFTTNLGQLHAEDEATQIKITRGLSTQLVCDTSYFNIGSLVLKMQA